MPPMIVGVGHMATPGATSPRNRLPKIREPTTALAVVTHPSGHD